jgi:hypothetical protein
MTKSCVDGFPHFNILVSADFGTRVLSFTCVIGQFAIRQGAPIFFVTFRRRLRLGCGNRALDLGDRILTPLAQSFRVEQILIDNQFFCAFEAILREWLALDFIGHITGVVVFSMAGEA